MILEFLLIEFLMTTQIANISPICNFDKDDKQFHSLWRSFDKCGSLQLSTNCLVFGQEYLTTTHSGKIRNWSIWISVNYLMEQSKCHNTSCQWEYKPDWLAENLASLIYSHIL